jgi:hypothetical protein
MLLQPPLLPTGTYKMTTGPAKINLQPGKVTITNHYFTIPTTKPATASKNDAKRGNEPTLYVLHYIF